MGLAKASETVQTSRSGQSVSRMAIFDHPTNSVPSLGDSFLSNSSSTKKRNVQKFRQPVLQLLVGKCLVEPIRFRSAEVNEAVLRVRQMYFFPLGPRS